MESGREGNVPEELLRVATFLCVSRKKGNLKKKKISYADKPTGV